MKSRPYRNQSVVAKRKEAILEHARIVAERRAKRAAEIKTLAEEERFAIPVSDIIETGIEIGDLK